MLRAGAGSLNVDRKSVKRGFWCKSHKDDGATATSRLRGLDASYTRRHPGLRHDERVSNTTLWDLLDDMYFSATSERDKGTKFERFLKSYLQTEPKYADLFSDVWLWQEWPGRAGRPDTGIDLVAQDRYTGEYTAVQAKFYDPSRALPKAEIDSFFTELGKAPFTNGMIVTRD